VFGAFLHWLSLGRCIVAGPSTIRDTDLTDSDERFRDEADGEHKHTKFNKEER